MAKDNHRDTEVTEILGFIDVDIEPLSDFQLQQIASVAPDGVIPDGLLKILSHAHSRFYVIDR